MKETGKSLGKLKLKETKKRRKDLDQEVKLMEKNKKRLNDKFTTLTTNLEKAKNALNSNPQYVSNDYQKKQLWGKKLQKSAQLLFKTKEMQKVVKEAKEKSQ